MCYVKKSWFTLGQLAKSYVIIQYGCQHKRQTIEGKKEFKTIKSEDRRNGQNEKCRQELE